MSNKVLFLVVGIIILSVIGYGIYQWAKYQAEPGDLDIFATCLKDSGAMFYGAYWCPHCQTQKKMFGKSEKLLPYIECSTPDGRGQLPVCKDAGIRSYPTWRFSDGEERSGELSLVFLSEKTGCQLP